MLVYIHVEEPSMEEALKHLLPKILGQKAGNCKIIDCSSKQNLLKTLSCRFKGYVKRINNDENIRVLVLVDRDNEAIKQAYPRFKGKPSKNPDQIKGGTWEKLLRDLQAAGYYSRIDFLPKIEVARKIAACMEPGRNISPSFKIFVSGIKELTQKA